MAKESKKSGTEAAQLEQDTQATETAEASVAEENMPPQDVAEMQLPADAESEEVVHLGEESSQESGGNGSVANIDLLLDVCLQVTVELGRKEMRFSEILELGKGSLIELNKIADEPVDIYVNQSKVAEGEVVVVDDHFGVRITRLLNADRLKKMG